MFGAPLPPGGARAVSSAAQVHPVALRRPGSKTSVSTFSPESFRARDASPVPSLASSLGPEDETLGSAKKGSQAFSRVRRTSHPKPLDEGELRAKVYLGRVRRLLVAKRRNWFSFFASFDTRRDGQLQEAEFEAALKSIGVALSDQEAREVRAHVQGNASSVSIDHFGAVLQQAAPPEVSRTETWGRSLLAGLAKEAGRLSSGVADGLGSGAMVRVKGLQSESGLKLNGLEGMVDKWDSAASRWVVWLNSGELKSLKPENLQVVRPGQAPQPGNSAGTASTVAFYKLLCKGGETLVSEEKFVASIRELKPDLDDQQGRRLLLLLPKNAEGLVDVPEVLAQLVASPAGGDAGHHGQPSLQQRSLSDASTGLPDSLPGSVPSPRDLDPSSSSASIPTLTGPSPGPSRSYVQAVLQRLGRRLLGRPPLQGPGVGVLRLFAASPEAVRLEELREAVTVLPLGISSAEVQSVFEHLRDFAGPTAAHYRDGAIPLAQLESVIEVSHAAGLPPEVAELGSLDLGPLASALQKLGSTARGGRVSPSEFRAAVSQAVPKLQAGQLELLTTLTDKDGDGFLLPFTLLAGLTASSGAAAAAARVVVPELPLPKGGRPVEAAQLLAPSLPRPLLADAVLARLRDRLSGARLDTRLPELVGLFGLVSGPDTTVRRNVLVSILVQLRLGISALEADELVCCLCGVKASEDDVRVHVADFFAGVMRPGTPEDWLPVRQMRDMARQRLASRGAALAANATALRRGDWLAERDFRRCLVTALAKEGQKVSSSEEDKMVLLAEKNASGEVRWRRFVETYTGGIRVSVIREPEASPAKSAGVVKSSPMIKRLTRMFTRSKEASI